MSGGCRRPNRSHRTIIIIIIIITIRCLKLNTSTCGFVYSALSSVLGGQLLPEWRNVLHLRVARPPILRVSLLACWHSTHLLTLFVCSAQSFSMLNGNHARLYFDVVGWLGDSRVSALLTSCSANHQNSYFGRPSDIQPNSEKMAR